MRLLHPGHHHDGRSSPGAEQPTNGVRHSGGAQRLPLSVWRLSANRASCPTSGRDKRFGQGVGVMPSRRGARQHMPQNPSGPEGERGADLPTSGDALLAHAATVVPARARNISNAHSMAELDSDDSEKSIANRLRIGADGLVTVYSGKVELGTGVRTALTQIVADALDVPFERITLVMGDTGLTPDEGGTTGSKTLQDAGTRLQRIATAARQILLARAAVRCGVPVDELQTRDGVVSVLDDPARCVPYAELAAEPFGQQARGQALRTRSSQSTTIGASIPRVDLLAKLTGGESFIHDLRLDGMLHGRVLRPFVRTMNGVGGATVLQVDDRAVRGMPGLVAIVRNGNFIGVVAEREEQVIRAAEHLRVTWSAPDLLPDQRQLHALMPQMPQQTMHVAGVGDVDGAFGRAERTLDATY